MFKWRNVFTARYHPTQISIYLISLMVTFIFLAFMVINVGKTAKDKTYADNAVDGGALAAASVMAYAFNYVAEANKKEQEKLEQNWEDFKTALNNYVENADRLKEQYLRISSDTRSKSCCATVCAATPRAEAAIRKIGEEPKQGFIGQVHQLIKGVGSDQADSDKIQESGATLGTIPNYWQLQENEYLAIREIVHDDGENASTGDLYHNALYAGYIFGFYNSGISHRLGRINQRRYSTFLQTITPDNVRNCEEKTFPWTDGAGRGHTVTVVVCIDDVHTYDLVETKDNRQTIKQNLDEAKRLANQAINTINSEAIPKYNAACACASSPCCVCPPTCCCFPQCQADDGAGDAAMLRADALMRQAQAKVVEAQSGIEADETRQSTSKTDTDEDVIKYIEEIQHDRKVRVFTFQFHMGGPVKGGRGDVDFPTFYPPVQSQATADFRGNGSIYPQQPRHDARLESAN